MGAMNAVKVGGIAYLGWLAGLAGIMILLLAAAVIAHLVDSASPVTMLFMLLFNAVYTIFVISMMVTVGAFVIFVTLAWNVAGKLVLGFADFIINLFGSLWVEAIMGQTFTEIAMASDFALMDITTNTDAVVKLLDALRSWLLTASGLYDTAAAAS